MLLFMALGLIALYLYYQPIPLFSTDHAFKSVQQICELNDSDPRVYTSFKNVTRNHLLFLLRGIYISQLAKYSAMLASYPLQLYPVSGGHWGKHEDTLFIYLRASHTSHDFVNDICLTTSAAAVGRVYNTPLRLARRLMADIKEKLVGVNRVVFTGMSLGASVAAIAAELVANDSEFDVDVQLVCFAPYCIGDKKYNSYVRKSVNSSWIIKNVCDVVTNAFANRVGNSILFDFECEDRSSNHCNLVSMLNFIDVNELITDKAFYFSDENPLEDEEPGKVVAVEGNAIDPVTGDEAHGDFSA